MLQQKYSEKRDFIRIDVETNIKFTIADDSTIYDGICHNLSGNGVLFKTNVAIPNNALLELYIAPQIGNIAPLKLKVRVIRIEQQGQASIIAGKVQKIYQD